MAKQLAGHIHKVALMLGHQTYTSYFPAQNAAF
jgi:hypothetical protein